MIRILVATDAWRPQVNGVVCGHIHHPTIREIDGVTYVNTGDFVESCSLVVEHQDGRLEVKYWSKPFAGQALVVSKDRIEAEAEAA